MFALRLYSSLWTDLYPHGKHTIAYKYQRNTAFVNHCILQLQNDAVAVCCCCNHSLKLEGKRGRGRINFFIDNGFIFFFQVHIKPEKMLNCPKCPFVTEYKHHLEYHLRNHFGSKPFKCPNCSYTCVNKSMLNSHMKSHTNIYQYR